jgi:hypothetical protein
MQSDSVESRWEAASHKLAYTRPQRLSLFIAGLLSDCTPSAFLLTLERIASHGRPALSFSFGKRCLRPNYPCPRIAATTPAEISLRERRKMNAGGVYPSLNGPLIRSVQRCSPNSSHALPPHSPSKAGGSRSEASSQRRVGSRWRSWRRSGMRDFVIPTLLP